MEKVVAVDGYTSPMSLKMLSPTTHTNGVLSTSPPTTCYRVQVVNAMDGVRHEVDLTSRATVNVLRQELVLKTGIPCDEQILLYGPPYARLDPKKSMESYQLHLVSKSVYVYDRRVLSQDNPPIPRVVLHPQTVDVPRVPASSSSTLLQETSSPLLRALFDYETQFHQQYLMAEAVEEAGTARLASTDACIEQLRAQSNGIQAALANLETHHTAMTQRFTPFWKEFQAASDDHAQLLANFDAYVARLKGIPLHPALATATRTTLVDCIPLDRERDWLVSCQQSHGSLQSKMEALAASYHTVSDTITSSRHNAPSAISSEVLRQKDAFATSVTSLASMRQTLRENYEAVSKRVAETTQQTLEEASSTTTATSMNMSFMFGSTHILEACRGLDDLFRQQADVLPAMQKLDDELKDFMNGMAKAKEEFFPVVYAQLKLVSQLQSDIVDFETHLGILRDALAYQKRQFAELKHIEKLPEAYDACLVEIKRRRKYGRVFQLRINEMGEKMVAMREEEIMCRESFLREHGQHLPRDFAPGLTEKPSHCIVSMRPFDTNLPAIEEDALDEPPTELQLLKQRCLALEAQVADLQSELDEQKKASCHCDDSYSNSSSLSASVDTALQGPKFPLVLALAATAGLNNSSESVKDHEHIKRLKETLYEKDTRLAQLEDTQSSLNDTVQQMQFNMGMQRNWLKKVTHALSLPECDWDSAEGMHDTLMQIEDKWKTKRESTEQSDGANVVAAAAESWDDQDKMSKIAFRAFSYNDLALFLPTFAPNDVNAAKIYLAFHLGCPNRFLSDESITTFYQTQNRYPEYILGRIVYIDERVATERDNPYRLITGTTFYVLTVTCLVEY
ncbi:Aste57867_25053 [Aphanomyces stellatus]|uniref:Aste57867_25053 protein n=1 Tax=Aphanomyces stellatus TaxID=120398 RepID=A0A485LS47_9STRA|nr:hypothetical protein As57867_024975 [Aphanomyces stellatus]VFU01684.1 Aste57867_25053 [Aphanomyces stellatus]